MSIYHCALCDEQKDNDWHPCSEYGDELICDDCQTEIEDPTPWCHICHATHQSGCNCGPIASNH